MREQSILRRLVEAGTRIANMGYDADGTEVDGPEGLKRLLLSRHREDFAAAVTEKLLTYALGRGLEYYDKPAVRAIVKQAAGEDYRLSALINGIVESTPFQMRRAK